MNISDWLKKNPNVEPGFISPQTTELVQTRNRPKISVVNQFFPPDYAPTGQLIEELVKQLDRQGAEVEVFTGQPGYAFQATKAPAFEKLGRVEVKRSRTSQLFPYRIRGKALNGILFSIRTFLYLLNPRRHNNIVLLTSAPPFLPILGYLASLLFGISYVCLIYDLYPDIAIELGVIPADHWLAKVWQAINRQVWQQSKGVIVLSPAMKDRVTSICPEVEHKVSVIHSWANPDWITPLPKEDNWFAQEHQLVEPFTVLYSGNMGRCHDVDTILSAAIHLHDEPVRFVCIGAGAKREGLMQQVQELGLENFTFLPYQDRHVLPYSLTACDLSLVSVAEGMESLVAPSKLYSALSSGRPLAVICPQHSYLNQLVSEAGCGASFNNGDGKGLAQFIRFLVSDRPTAEKMGTAGRSYLQQSFTPEAIAKQYFKVLRRAAA
ncbi:glycosyltransferase family 4 protein [Leptolyngbya sp. FACHB-541]|uniref:glycosyltransferase family 4 protein n=1 Tax=Leptolyngbya sp. FACHB-541 TaxID=2692810 RepID=UPI001688F7CD|nr:glycosyltransferase family 4 protein [Leptolyngbya sp. FACHB-541]MBD2001076.1 glycosyltransferase family 4 protein [Leptolyngbya sp. FACHB-541]